MRTKEDLDLRLQTLLKHAEANDVTTDFRSTIVQRIQVKQVEILKSAIDGILNGLSASELEYLKKGIINGTEVNSSQQDILDERSHGSSAAHPASKRTRRRQPRAPSGSVLGS